MKPIAPKNISPPLKWGYGVGGTLVDSSRVGSAPQVNIYGPLANCSALDGFGGDAVVAYTGPGSTTTTYDPVTKTWHQNIKLNGQFAGDRCYLIQVTDSVTGVTSEVFPIKTKK